MTLSAGTHLGPYEIRGPLGSGGMGEVYRARDTRLERGVAIKALPAAFARDPERLARGIEPRITFSEASEERPLWVGPSRLSFVEVTPAGGRVLAVNAQQNDQPVCSPDGKELACIESRNTLKILNLESKQARTVLTEKEIFAGGPSHHFRWSPDSRWILFDCSIPGIAPGEVGVVAADGKGTPANLTLSGFNDDRAKRILGGKATLQEGLRWGVPGVGVKDSTTGKYLENLQAEPDIKLMNEYHVVITGKDRQREAAVAELMTLVK